MNIYDIEIKFSKIFFSFILNCIKNKVILIDSIVRFY